MILTGKHESSNSCLTFLYVYTVDHSIYLPSFGQWSFQTTKIMEFPVFSIVFTGVIAFSRLHLYYKNIVGTIVQSNRFSSQIHSFPLLDTVNSRLKLNVMSRISLRELTIETAQLQCWIIFLNNKFVFQGLTFGAIFLPHSQCIDSLNPHKCKIQNYLPRKLRISNSLITNFLFANCRFELISQITFFHSVWCHKLQ